METIVKMLQNQKLVFQPAAVVYPAAAGHCPPHWHPAASVAGPGGCRAPPSYAGSVLCGH